MDENFILKTIYALLKDFLSGVIPAKEMIMKYDSIMTSPDFPWESSIPIFQELDRFQDVLSLYVDNPDWRKEHESYYGEDKLRVLVNNMAAQLNGLFI
jgi:hypothetical protein